LICLHIFLAYRKETTLEYSRYLREQYLAELALKEEDAEEESTAKKKGFWTLFFSQTACKKKATGKVSPEPWKGEGV
jgi:hypothetical protein